MNASGNALFFGTRKAGKIEDLQTEELEDDGFSKNRYAHFLQDLENGNLNAFVETLDRTKSPTGALVKPGENQQLADVFFEWQRQEIESKIGKLNPQFVKTLKQGKSEFHVFLKGTPDYLQHQIKTQAMLDVWPAEDELSLEYALKLWNHQKDKQTWNITVKSLEAHEAIANDHRHPKFPAYEKLKNIIYETMIDANDDPKAYAFLDWSSAQSSLPGRPFSYKNTVDQLADSFVGRLGIKVPDQKSRYVAFTKHYSFRDLDYQIRRRKQDLESQGRNDLAGSLAGSIIGPPANRRPIQDILDELPEKYQKEFKAKKFSKKGFKNNLPDLEPVMNLAMDAFVFGLEKDSAIDDRFGMCLLSAWKASR